MECFFISLIIASCCTFLLNLRIADSIDSPSSTTTKAKNVHLLIIRYEIYIEFALLCQGNVAGM